MAALSEGNITERVAAKTEGAEPPYHVLWNAPGLPMSFGLIAYCFSGHAIVPSIYSSMRKPQDFERVVDVTFLIVTVACFAVGVSGYWMFGNLVRDQVTLSLEHNSSAKLAVTVLTYLMILTAYSKITLTMFPLALGIEEIFAPYLSSERASEFASSIIKMILLALALVMSIYCPSFSFLCELVGIICTMTVSVIFPAAAHLKLFGPKLNFLDTLMDYTFVIVGTVMAVVGTYLALS
jgi:vesicular inhibitory amino acid transporter